MHVYVHVYKDKDLAHTCSEANDRQQYRTHSIFSLNKRSHQHTHTHGNNQAEDLLKQVVALSDLSRRATEVADEARISAESNMEHDQDYQPQHHVQDQPVVHEDGKMACMRVSVCVCQKEREREGERERDTEGLCVRVRAQPLRV